MRLRFPAIEDTTRYYFNKRFYSTFVNLFSADLISDKRRLLPILEQTSFVTSLLNDLLLSSPFFQHF